MADNWITIVSVGALLVSVMLLGLMVVLRYRPLRQRAPVNRLSAGPRPGGAVGRYLEVQSQVARTAVAPPPADGLGERLHEVEQQLRLLAERQDQLDLRQPANHAYRLAIKLAKKGVPVNDLVTTCGINRGEAELIATLHRYRKASGV